MKRLILIAAVILFAFPSCKKDSNTDSNPTNTVLEYLPLAIGNYWVYERSSCDSTWTNCQLLSIDTNFVTKDTLINGYVYFKIEGQKFTGPSVTFVRDSLDYIVDDYGKIWFSNKDFVNILDEQYVIQNDDTLYHWYNKMDTELATVHVPLGEFLCLDNKLHFFRIQDNFKKEYNCHKSFAKDIGIVYENVMFASSTGGLKRELIGYNIVP